jgi:hypothetical protein
MSWLNSTTEGLNDVTLRKLVADCQFVETLEKSERKTKKKLVFALACS